MREWILQASGVFAGIMAAYVLALLVDAIARHREAKRNSVKPRSSW